MNPSPLKPLVLPLLLALPLLPVQAFAAPDEILLRDGSRIVGTVKSVRDGVVTIETGFAGTLSVKQDQIENLSASGPVVIKLADESVLEAPELQVENRALTLPTDVAPESAYKLEELALLNPEPWELGRGYHWTGLASMALGMQRGNTDTDELDYRLDNTWRSLDDRYSLRVNGEVDEANGVKNAENWAALGKYDRFLNGSPNYWGINASAEQDKFADLDLRYYLGPYLGRQFYEQPVLTLSAEAGVVYVNEKFISADDQDYQGANWTVNASSNYLGGSSRLYLNHTGIWNLDQTDEVVLNLVLGLSFPMFMSIEGAAEVLLEYDSGLPSEVEELDQTYRFRVGYSW